MYYMALDCRELAKNEFGIYVLAFCFILFLITKKSEFVVAVCALPQSYTKCSLAPVSLLNCSYKSDATQET